MMEIKSEKFSGPLDLLLKLIEKEELNITEISLANIADEYLSMVKATESIEPEEMADFLVLAARLLYLKSKALFPTVQFEEEENFSDLEKQLKMYKKFQEASKKIAEIIGKDKFMYAREFNRNAITGLKRFSPPKKLTKEDLKNAFTFLLDRLVKIEKLEEKQIEITLSIDDKIKHIQQELTKRVRFAFSSIANSTATRVEKIVSFLAMLELAKQRDIIICQDELFGEIFIDKF